MPQTLIKALNVRTRTNKRIWSPLAPGLIVYQRNGLTFTRTYENPSYKWNIPYPAFDPKPPHVRFNPDTVPPLVLRKNPATVLSDQLQTSYVAAQVPPPSVGNVPGISPAQSQTAGGAGSINNLIRVYTNGLLVGTSSKALYPYSLIAKTVNVQADNGNVGNIWLSQTKNNVAGNGQKIVPGQSASMGSLTLPGKYIDLSTIYVVGENVNDTVYILAQIVSY